MKNNTISLVKNYVRIDYVYVSTPNNTNCACNFTQSYRIEKANATKMVKSDL